MVALRAGVLAALLLASSCTGVFDSYFPATVEFIDTQADLAGALGNKTISTVQMQLLSQTAAHSGLLLTVIAATSDGVRTVLFYDHQLKLLRKYKDSEITAATGVDNPRLSLIEQDGAGVYTGDIWYWFPTVKGAPELQAAGYLPTFLQTNFGLANFSTAYDSTNLSASLFQSQGSATIGVGSAEFVQSIAGTTPITSLPSAAQTFLNGGQLLNATWSKGHYYLMLGSGGNIMLVDDPSPDPSFWGSASTATVTLGQFGYSSTGSAWATGTAAVIRSQSDNGLLLQAYSWSGKAKGSIRIPSNNSDIVFAFDPDGTVWFMYDPSNGRISSNRPWW